MFTSLTSVSLSITRSGVLTASHISAAMDRSGFGFSSGTRSRLHRRSATPVYYAVITDLIIRGEVATVVFGSDMLVPSRERDVIIMCCELATDEYQRTGRGWKFVKRIRVVAY